MKPQSRDLRAALAEGQPLIADGGMGTSLYDRGFFVNRSFEELCLTNANDVREVTQGFFNAGAQLLSTNTFGANVPKLTPYGLQDQLDAIVRAAVSITRSVAEQNPQNTWVVGAMGPLGLVLEPLGPTSLKEAEDFFVTTARFLEDAGVDAFELETFSDLNELEAAVRAVRRVSQKPLFANLTIQENQKTSYGHTLSDFVSRMGTMNVDGLGLNCNLGPSEMFDALEVLRGLTKKPIAILPNAGLPRYVNDRYIYLCNPDYIGKYAKRFVSAGANIVGGCCGTTAAHIKAITNNVRMLSPKDQRQVMRVREATPVHDRTVTVKSIETRSKLGRALHDKKRVISVELVPPKGVSVDKFIDHCRQLKDGGVEFVNIPDGARAVARMGSLHLSSFVQNKIGLEAIPHFTARDRNLIGLQSDLLGAYVSGVRNVLLVTGDPPKLGNCPDASAVYDVDAIGLTHIANRMNHGLDLGGAPFGEPTGFVIGVALNPTAINVELEISRFNYKLEAGANYAITQPIYDLEAYTRFWEKRDKAPEIPVIMGIWPLVSHKNAEFLKYEVPGVEVPDWVIREMEKAGDNAEEGLKRGFDIAMKTMEEAKNLVAGFQVSAPFNRVQVALDVIHALSR